MPPMRSAEYQANECDQSKSLPGFRVVVTSRYSVNGWSIHTLLREENDSKQSDEIQAKEDAQIVNSKSQENNFFPSLITKPRDFLSLCFASFI